MRRPVLLLPRRRRCDGEADRTATAAGLAARRSESCVLPTTLPAPEMERVRPDEVVAGRTIVFHMLAVTWMPETCKAGGDGEGDLACDSENRFGWTLHGLWPERRRQALPALLPPGDAGQRGDHPRQPVPHAVGRSGPARMGRARDLRLGDAGGLFRRRRPRLYDGLKRPDPDDAGAGRARPDGAALRDAFAAANPGCRATRSMWPWPRATG